MVPSELRAAAQWLVWRFEKKDGVEKLAKMPYYTNGKKRQGPQGSDEDRQQLTLFDHAFNVRSREKYDGIGFAFLPGDGLIGIDLDRCIDEKGEMAERAQRIVALCASYTEYSPSKRGVHIFVKASRVPSFKSNDIGVEVFCGSQFFTFTGEHFSFTPQTINTVDDSVIARLKALVDKAKDAGREQRSTPPGASAGGGTDDFARVNDAAIANLDAWVPSLFPGAKRAAKGWRVSSKSLGRDLQEDLSITRDGIVDWGVNDIGDAREGRRTPIDLVLEWGGVAAAKDALHWLAERLAVAIRRPPAAARRAGPSPPASSSSRPDFFRNPEDWETQLTRGSKGQVLPTLANVYLILCNHEAWKELIAIDEFAGCITKVRAPPFGGVAAAGEWSDIDDGQLCLWLAQQYGIEPHDRILEKAVMNAAQLNRFHPVRTYLKGLKWDETRRLDRWLVTHMGAVPVAPHPDDIKWNALPPRETYLGKVGLKYLVGAVARVMRPGCKMDNVLILEGTQGIGKSSAFGVLADPWFTDQQIKIGEKDTYEVMRGNWIMELAELDALSRSDSSAAKAFFSRAKDRFRAFYGRRAATIERQQVFGGTVNHGQYLRDSSGNRRYWPVKCAHADVDLKKLAAERDQLWAEAVELYEWGEPWWVKPEERWLFEAEQEARYVGDAWEMRIRRYLSEPGMAGLNGYVTTDELLGLALQLDMSKWTQPEQIRVGFIMDRIGWERRRLTIGGDRAWRYYRPEPKK